MKKNPMITILVLGMALALAACGKDETSSLKIDFITDYTKGMALAKERGKPVMLVFDADWCGWCKKLKKEVFADKGVGEASSNLVNLLIDIDKDRKTATQYNVRGVPSIFFMDPAGSNIMPYQGPRDSESFIKIMNAFADRYKTG